MADHDSMSIHGGRSIEENAYWLFSTAFYVRPDVSRLLLKAQNDHALDINMILYALWKAGEGYVLSSNDFSKLDEVVADWRETIVRPIRVLRLSLKSRDQKGELYAQAKTLELSCEKLQQQMMYEQALPRRKPEPSGGGIEQLVLVNLASYVEVIGLSFPKPLAAELAQKLQEFVED